MDMYVIEGENLIGEALLEKADIRWVIVRTEDERRLRDRYIDAIEQKIGEKRIFCAEKSLFDRLALTENSQGIVAAVSKPPQDGARLYAEQSGGNVIVMDRLQDPGNIGTVIRTADAAGYTGCVVMKGTADIYSPKVVRAAAGSLFRMPVIFMESVEELKLFAQHSGRRLTASCIDGDRYYFEEDLKDKIALIVGNEGSGVSREMIEAAELRIKIPMRGRTESLNAAVAAAIIMYEAVRAGK